jgi:hypothetical protein
MLSVIMLNVIMLCVVMLKLIMLNVVMLSVTMLNVAAPEKNIAKTQNLQTQQLISSLNGNNQNRNGTTTARHKDIKQNDTRHSA